MHDFYDVAKYTLKPAGENPTYPKEDKGKNLQYLSLARNVAEVDRVQASHEEQEFWMTRLDWVGTQLNQFEILENMKTVY